MNPSMEIVDSDLTAVAASDLPTLIAVGSPNCPACKMMASAVDEAAKAYKGRMRVARAQADKNARFLEMTGINKLPTFLIIKNKEEVDRLEGRVPNHIFNEFIERYA